MVKISEERIIKMLMKVECVDLTPKSHYSRGSMKTKIEVANLFPKQAIYFFFVVCLFFYFICPLYYISGYFYNGRRS